MLLSYVFRPAQLKGNLKAICFLLSISFISGFHTILCLLLQDKNLLFPDWASKKSFSGASLSRSYFHRLSGGRNKN